jgi:hypothetical protein
MYAADNLADAIQSHKTGYVVGVDGRTAGAANPTVRVSKLQFKPEWALPMDQHFITSVATMNSGAYVHVGIKCDLVFKPSRRDLMKPDGYKSLFQKIAEFLKSKGAIQRTRGLVCKYLLIDF